MPGGTIEVKLVIISVKSHESGPICIGGKQLRVEQGRCLRSITMTAADPANQSRNFRPPCKYWSGSKESIESAESPPSDSRQSGRQAGEID